MPHDRMEDVAELCTRLGEFLLEPIESEGGYAVASRGDTNELRDIFRSIIDLKFDRDPDGVQVMEFDLVNQRYERLISERIPHNPRDIEEPPLMSRMEYLHALMQAQSYLMSKQESISTEIRLITSTLVVEELLITKLADLRKEFDAALSRKDFDEARRIITVVGGTAEGVRNANGLVPFHDERADAFRDDLAPYFENEVAEYREALKSGIDAIENADLANRVPESEAYMVLNGGQSLYGRGTFRLERDRFNEVCQARHVARKAAKLKG